MSMDRVEEQCMQDKETEAALTGERLDAAICRGLRSVMGEAEPPPASWRRIRQRAIASESPTARARPSLKDS